MKNKRFKSFFAILLAVTLVFSTNLTSASAAKKKSDSKKVKVSSVRVVSPATSKKIAYVAKGKTIKLSTTVKVKPNKKANKGVTYKTADKKIATVSPKGIVKGKKLGTTKITVTSKKDSKKKKTIKIKVVNPIKKVALDKKNVTIGVGKTAKLKASVTAPKKNTFKALKWTTSNKKVVTVKKGVIKAVGSGTAKVTVTSLDGTKKKAVCNVVVGSGIESVDVVNPLKSRYSNIISVKLDSPKELKAGDFQIKTKAYPDGKYVKQLDIEYIFTADNVNYKLYLKDYYLVGGDYIQVTIPALTVNKTVEKQFETVATENEIVVSGMVGENIYEGIYTDLRGCTVSKLESGTLPSGISYLEKQPAFSGVAKAVADNQKVVINTTNEYGETEKTTYNFLIGSTSQIVVESKTIGAKDGDKIYSHQYVYESIRVAGATGGAVVQLTDDCGGKFKIDGANIRDDDSFHIYTEDTGKLEAGTYIVKYRVRDKINVFKMVYGTLTVIVSPSVLVKTNIINNAQSEPSLVFYNHDLESEIWSDSYVIDNNIIQYETYLPQGNYSVCYYSYGRYGLFDKYIAINSEKILNYIYNSKATIKLNILDSKGNIFKRKCYVELYKSEDFEKNAFPYSVHTAYPYYDLQLATLIDGKFADVLPGNYVIKVFDYNTDEEISEPISVNVGRSDVTADIKTIISNY